MTLKMQSGSKQNLDIRNLFDVHFVPLCAYAYKYLDSYDKAEDLVQDVFIKIWNNKSSIESKSAKQYLYTAVRNNCFKLLEKTKRFRFEDIETCSHELIEELFEPLEQEARLKKLYHEIDRLPEHCRLVFEGIVFERKKYSEVAQDLDISINTVKTQYSRALKRLRGSAEIVLMMLLL